MNIDIAKFAVTRACAQDPTVQRAHAECAEGYNIRRDARTRVPPRRPGANAGDRRAAVAP